MSKFGGTYLVTTFEYLQRFGNEKNKDVTLFFSDGSSQKFVLHNTNVLQTFAVAPVRSEYVRLWVTSHHSKVNNGAKTIRYSQEFSSTDYRCPSTVSKANWLGTLAGALTFAVSQSNKQITVKRTDSTAAWTMDLQFSCCHQGLTEENLPRRSAYACLLPQTLVHPPPASSAPCSILTRRPPPPRAKTRRARPPRADDTD